LKFTVELNGKLIELPEAGTREEALKKAGLTPAHWQEDKPITATLTYKGKSVEMGDTKASEKLVTEILTDTIPQIKKESKRKMPELKMNLKNIQKFKATTETKDVKDVAGNDMRQIVSKVSFEVEGVADCAMIHHALANDVVVDVIVGSHQALMNVDMVTGEIKS